MNLNSFKKLKPRITKSGRIVIPVHYSCDPDKDPSTSKGKEWLENEKKWFLSLGEGNWNSEYELSFTTWKGTPVVPNFNKSLHTSNYPGYLKDRELILGFDFGGVNPAYTISQIDSVGRWIWHKGKKLERKPGIDVDPDTMCQDLINEFNNKDSNLFNANGWQLVVICDISGTYESNQGVKNAKGFTKAADILQEHFKTKIIANKVPIKSSIDGLVQMFSRLRGGQSEIIVNPSCTSTIKLLEGGWHYPEEVDKKAKQEPEKDGIFIHMGDCWRYVYWHFFRTIIPKNMEDKREDYTFAYD